MTQQKQLKSGSSATKQICLVDAAYDLNKNIIDYLESNREIRNNKEIVK